MHTNTHTHTPRHTHTFRLIIAYVVELFSILSVFSYRTELMVCRWRLAVCLTGQSDLELSVCVCVWEMERKRESDRLLVFFRMYYCAHLHWILAFHQNILLSSYSTFSFSRWCFICGSCWACRTGLTLQSASPQLFPHLFLFGGFDASARGWICSLRCDI